MKITKLEHSGIAIEKNGQVLIFDPVEYTKQMPVFQNVVAIVITHKHSDHLQPNVLDKIIGNNPEAKIFTTEDAAPSIVNDTIVHAGDSYTVGEFKLDFFGKDHAAIVPGQVPCMNIGVVVDDAFVNPGDSFDLPATPAKILMVPTSGPWVKTIESMEYIERAKPELVIPFHNAMLSEFGEGTTNNWMLKACEKVGAEFAGLKPGESIVK